MKNKEDHVGKNQREYKWKKPLQPLDDNVQADLSLVPLTDSQENCLLDDLNDMDGVDDILRSIDANENVFKQTVNHNSVQANAMLPAAPVLRNCSNVIINCNITCSGIPIINWINKVLLFQEILIVFINIALSV